MGVIAPKQIHKKLLIPIHLKKFLKSIINQNHYGERVSKVNASINGLKMANEYIFRSSFPCFSSHRVTK
jgi:hypothetical protein